MNYLSSLNPSFKRSRAFTRWLNTLPAVIANPDTLRTMISSGTLLPLGECKKPYPGLTWQIYVEFCLWLGLPKPFKRADPHSPKNILEMQKAKAKKSLLSFSKAASSSSPRSRISYGFQPVGRIISESPIPYRKKQ